MGQFHIFISPSQGKHELQVICNFSIIFNACNSWTCEACGSDHRVNVVEHGVDLQKNDVVCRLGLGPGHIYIIIYGSSGGAADY